MARILAISGSTRPGSTNWKLLDHITGLLNDIELIKYPSLADLPHFDPDPELTEIPATVLEFRGLIEECDGIVICTPEYIFAIPAVVKNALEWLVSTVLLDQKPVLLVTASAIGEKTHEQMLTVLQTMSANVQETNMLISGIRSKIDNNGNITNEQLRKELSDLAERFRVKIAN